jgi:hypothetical protein
MGQTAVIPAQIVDVAARSLLGNNTNAAAACQTISFATASSGDVLTVQGDGSVAFAAPSGGIGGSAGSTDNAVLRADGAGGATLQGSGWIIPDIYTASPNATVNHLSLQATGSSTNVSVSIVPKGSGAFSLAVPDGTTAGGNARGANAIDLQTTRTNANQVAAGDNSIVIGVNSRTNNTGCIAIGPGASATGGNNVIAIGNASANGAEGSRGSIAIGTASVTERSSIAIGASSVTGIGSLCICPESGSVTVSNATAIGTVNTIVTAHCGIAIGAVATASRQNELTFGFRHSAFDVRVGGFFLSASTTNNTPTALQLRNLFGSPAFTTRSNTILTGILQVSGSKSDGSALAVYTRRLIFKNVSGTITLVESQIIGTDYEDNASTDLTISGTSPFFTVTGINAENWRWSAWFFPTIEFAFG